MRIGVLISGNGSNLQSIIDNEKYINAKVEVVISSKDSYGLERARNHNIDAYYETDEEKIITILKEKNVDLVVLAGYLTIISPKFVDSFKDRIINIHPSLIPSFCGKGYYGMNVHKNVINSGVKVSGATIHFVDYLADTGPIIMQDIVYIENNDDEISLSKKVLEVEHRILVESIKLFVENKLKIEGKRVIINEGVN